jgi:hypothetical protein
MFKKLFSAKRTLTKCVVLYSFRYDRKLTQDLFDFIIEYFKENYSVQFKYLGFYDEKYDDKYGKYDTNYPKIKKAKWDELVNISLDVENLRDKKRSICVEFNITRPVHLTVVLNEEISFDFKSFVERVYPFFKAEYGFNYDSYDNYWATAYAIGDREHGKEVHNIKRLSKEHFEQWLSKCEKISEGFLRDIYEENVLSTAQLNHSINGRSLKEFIVSENMGELSMINNDVFFWKLNDDQLKKCREILYKTDLLI